MGAATGSVFEGKPLPTRAGVVFDGRPSIWRMMDVLMRAGMQPVVRIGAAQCLPGRNRWITRYPRLARQVPGEIIAFNAGHRARFIPLVEVMAPVNARSSWDLEHLAAVDWRDRDLIRRVAASWWQDACAVLDWGGYPRLPVVVRNAGRFDGRHWWSGVMAALVEAHGEELAPLMQQGRVWQ